MLVCLGSRAGSFFFCFALKEALITKYIKSYISVIFTAFCHLQTSFLAWSGEAKFADLSLWVCFGFMSNVKHIHRYQNRKETLYLHTYYCTRASAPVTPVPLAALEGCTRCNPQSLNGVYFRIFLL